MKNSTAFLSVRTEGALFPPDILAQIASKTFEGVTPEAYHLDGENLNEAISRSWNRLLGVWKSFQTARAALSTGDFGTTLTREKWLYKLFQELGYGRLQSTRSFEIDGKSYPVSHLWRNVPIHLVGCGVDIDKTHVSPGVVRHQPHGMVQEFLNRSDDHLFALLSNGLHLRLLRDNASLVRRAFVEFDLESMMDGESFPDFSLLWLLCHQSRVEADRPEESPLERWVQGARKEGVQALDRLREGVEGAIVALGAGFLEHRANDDLRNALRAGRLDRQDYYRSVLRLVYRLVFLFVAEERDLLCPVERGGEGATRRRQYLTRYLPHYSLTRIRRLAERHPGSRHDDLYRMTAFVLERLGDAGSEELGLSPLGSGLFDPGTYNLSNGRLSNHAFLDAIRALTILSDEGHGRRSISYRNLGSEELGSVYEFLLELHPDLNLEAMTFALKSAAGNERKTTGSYYTPTSLIESLLKTALEPKLDEAARQPDPEKAILGLKVCDPACGSGHFLVAAAHRMAGRLGQIRCGGEPSELVFRQALRDVIGHCIYGVDINPMSVELCKVSLWMESMEPGKPLSFLDHRIMCGNSLLGTTPSLMSQGVPDEAFQPLEGDERAWVTTLRRQNRAERAGQGTLQFGGVVSTTTNRLGEALRELDRIGDADIEGIREKEEKHRALLGSEELARARESAGAWCASFVASRTAGVPQWTHDAFRRVSEGGLSALPSVYRESFRRLSEEYRLFHWHVAFPDVFSVPEAGVVGAGPHGWSGGFDIVLGNPPWDISQLGEEEYFAERRPDIAALPGARRKAAIRALEQEDLMLWKEYLREKRFLEGTNHFIREGGLFPRTARGKLNSYALFADLFLHILSPDGRAGVIVQSDIAIADSCKEYFDFITQDRRLVSFFDMVNLEGIFPGIHRTHPHFCLMTLTGRSHEMTPVYSFYNTNTGHLDDELRQFTLSSSEIGLLNPNTKTCSIFRTKIDAELTKKIYARVPVLINESKGENGNPWEITFRQGLFNMTSDSNYFNIYSQLSNVGAMLDGTIFHDPEGRTFLPLYEAKMVHQFDHRWATYERNGNDSREATDVEKANPGYLVLPRYWVAKEEVESRLADKGWTRNWLIGWRDITNATNERTVIAGAVPRCGVGNKFPLIFLDEKYAERSTCLIGNLNSMVLDYCARQKVGGTTLNYFLLKQFPVFPPSAYDEAALSFIVPRVLELVYTADDLRPFAVDLGFTGNPFPWDPGRRTLLRAELDAYYARLYGLTRDELRYILDPADVYGEGYPSETFRVLKNNEMREYGEYRTRRLVLEAWDKVSREEKTDR